MSQAMEVSSALDVNQNAGTYTASAPIEMVTLGCRLNTFESESMRRAAESAGLSNIAIVNTCAVTGEAVRQARQTIRKLARHDPTRHIIVTGCAAQTEAATFAAMPEVTSVLGNSEKMQASAWANLPKSSVAVLSENSTSETIAAINIVSEKMNVSDIMQVKSEIAPSIAGIEGRSRAFLQVQNGCDHRCTFCIIPFGRGNSRSQEIAHVINQVRQVVENGYHEVVLTGVDITSFGADLPELRGKTPRLGTLVRAILRDVPALKRLRLSSIDSIEADPELLAVIAEEPRFMPHLHLSLQAGDDMILKRMKRRHTRADSVRFCVDMRALRPDMAFSADLIAGFPTETEAHFQNTYDLIADCGLSSVHVFPFSPRPGTPAARMPQLNGTLIKERAARLRARAEEEKQIQMGKLLGTTQMLLMEKTPQHAQSTNPTRVHYFGRTENFMPVICAVELTTETPQNPINFTAGNLAKVRIEQQNNAMLIATPVDFSYGSQDVLKTTIQDAMSGYPNL